MNHIKASAYVENECPNCNGTGTLPVSGLVCINCDAATPSKKLEKRVQAMGADIERDKREKEEEKRRQTWAKPQPGTQPCYGDKECDECYGNRMIPTADDFIACPKCTDSDNPPYIGDLKTCVKCRGKGKILKLTATSETDWITCTGCDGSGYTKKTCPVCEGVGLIIPEPYTIIACPGCHVVYRKRPDAESFMALKQEVDRWE